MVSWVPRPCQRGSILWRREVQRTWSQLQKASPTLKGGTVWILGAGFSRALGGPLIAGLLADRDRLVLQEFFVPSYPRGEELVLDNMRAR